MRSINYVGLTLAAMLAVAAPLGCSWVHQTATLRLEPAITSSHVGRGKTINVQVVDKRPTKTLGYRGLDSKNAKITTEQDVAALFRDRLVLGFEQKGFRPESNPEKADRLVLVEIENIQYTTDMDFWKGTALAQTSLRLGARKRDLRFDQIYRGERKEAILEAPGEQTNERLISGSMSEAVERVFLDQRFMEFLME